MPDEFKGHPVGTAGECLSGDCSPLCFIHIIIGQMGSKATLLVQLVSVLVDTVLLYVSFT